jgi:hypothetical protein
MDNNNIFSIVAVVISIGSIIIGIFNHRRLRSKCNRTEVTASFDIDNTTPLIDKHILN